MNKLSRITQRKFIESYTVEDREILTPNGYVKILEVHKTVPYAKFRIITENGYQLECAYNHVVITENGSEVYAKDSIGYIVQTQSGNSKIISVENLNVEEHMYDISIDSEDEVYYSNGILSHNSGKTVTSGIYLSHTYTFKTDINIGITANRASQAREFLATVKNMIIELPIWMQPCMTSWNKSSIESENATRILTDAPSSDSFRGFTIHCLDGNSLVNVFDKYTNEFKTITLEELYDSCE